MLPLSSAEAEKLWAGLGAGHVALPHCPALSLASWLGSILLPGDVGQRKVGPGPLSHSRSLPLSPPPLYIYPSPARIPTFLPDPRESGKLLPSSQVGPCCWEIESGLECWSKHPAPSRLSMDLKSGSPSYNLGHLWAATSVRVCAHWGQAGK